MAQQEKTGLVRQNYPMHQRPLEDFRERLWEYFHQRKENRFRDRYHHLRFLHEKRIPVHQQHVPSNLEEGKTVATNCWNRIVLTPELELNE